MNNGEWMEKAEEMGVFYSNVIYNRVNFVWEHSCTFCLCSLTELSVPHQWRRLRPILMQK